MAAGGCQWHPPGRNDRGRERLVHVAASQGIGPLHGRTQFEDETRPFGLGGRLGERGRLGGRLSSPGIANGGVRLDLHEGSFSFLCFSHAKPFHAACHFRT